jgi:hypothetical protein
MWRRLPKLISLTDFGYFGDILRGSSDIGWKISGGVISREIQAVHLILRPIDMAAPRIEVVGVTDFL